MGKEPPREYAHATQGKRESRFWLFLHFTEESHQAHADKGKQVIKDKGCGIPDVACARQPLYTTDAEGERSGMGFTVMESFTDRMRVRSRVGKGTTVVLTKKLNGRQSGY